ncbi:hypothetical protein GGR52DRAFT_558036 [Hypoxylon sp. FL1284]|nr:hypothetical protein GGR52DRAFT_558036 [Hypoxylon sp. FL1284]
MLGKAWCRLRASGLHLLVAPCSSFDHRTCSQRLEAASEAKVLDTCYPALQQTWWEVLDTWLSSLKFSVYS